MIKIKMLTIKFLNLYLFKNLNFYLIKKNIYIIIGENGIGKSTLLKSFLNEEEYFISGEILFNNTNILNYKSDYISRMGIFYSHQNPIEICNIKNIYFLKICYDLFNFKKLNFFKIIKFYINKINFNKKLLFRNFNYGFSGGEKKKNEFLFLLMMNPVFILLDEIDSGLDFKSLKFVINYLNLIKKKKYILIITHNKNINFYLKADYYILIKKNTLNIFKCI